MPTSYRDGTWTTGFETGANLITYPFARYPVPDTTARVCMRSFAQLPANFTPLLAQRTTYTNYLLQSETFATTWTANSATVSSNTLANPMDGTTTADQFVEVAATAEHSVSQAYTFAAVSTVFSCFVKGLVRTWCRLKANDGTTDFTAFFNLSTGVASAGSNCTSSIYDAGGGWYRCIIVFTPAAAAGNVYVNAAPDGSTVSYAGNTADGLYLYGAQLERAAAVGPYAATTTASVSISAPQNDTANTAPGDIFAFLANESDLAISDLALAKYSRTYARIPSQKTVPSSLIVAKPDVPKTGTAVTAYIGNAAFQSNIGLCYYLSTTTPTVMVFQRNIAIPAWELYRVVNATGDSGVVTGANYVTGGTYTLTFSGNTTASINWNDSAATVSTRLNAGAKITALGGCTVAGSYTAGFTVTLHTLTTFALNTGSLVGTFTSSVQPSLGGYIQVVTIGGGVASGTFTITVLGQTTGNINYNASISDISTAINALGNVTTAGGCTIIGVGFIAGLISFAVQFSEPLITGTATSLTPNGSTIAATSYYSPVNYIQTVMLYGATGRSITVPSHGFVAGDTLVVAGNNAAGYVYPGLAYFDVTAYTILDANTISLTVLGSNLWNALPYITMLGVLRVTNYEPAPIITRCNNVTDYYLPGVSPGITTAADIPLPTPQSDPASFIAGLVNGATLNYEVGDVQPWMGPILSITKKVVSVKDLGVTTINLT